MSLLVLKVLAFELESKFTGLQFYSSYDKMV